MRGPGVGHKTTTFADRFKRSHFYEKKKKKKKGRKKERKRGKGSRSRCSRFCRRRSFFFLLKCSSRSTFADFSLKKFSSTSEKPPKGLLSSYFFILFTLKIYEMPSSSQSSSSKPQPIVRQVGFTISEEDGNATTNTNTGLGSKNNSSSAVIGSSTNDVVATSKRKRRRGGIHHGRVWKRLKRVFFASTNPERKKTKDEKPVQEKEADGAPAPPPPPLPESDKTKKRNEKLRKKNADDKNIWREWLQKETEPKLQKRRRKQNEGRGKRQRAAKEQEKSSDEGRRRRSKRRVVALLLLLLLLLVKGVARRVVAAIRVPRHRRWFNGRDASIVHGRSDKHAVRTLRRHFSSICINVHVK